MILAGIDEAGYGPVLGPLVVGCAAFRVARVPDPENPVNLWEMLKEAVCEKRDRTGRRIHVADSKMVYSGAGGLRALEEGVLAFAAVGGLDWGSLDGVLGGVDSLVLHEAARHPWYGPREVASGGYPLAVSRDLVLTRANGLRLACERAGVSVASLRARVVVEGRYNELVGRTRNKGSVLFSIVAGHLEHLLNTYAGEPGGLEVLCDRQGGREKYGEPLRTMFPDWRLGVEEETPALCRYTLTRDGQVARIGFREKGESASLATALASMLAKYLREAMMDRFNAYWCREIPGIAPTAGYYTDGMRWLAESAEARERLGVPEGEIVRER